MGGDKGPRPEPCPTCGCTRQHWVPKTRDHPVPALRTYRVAAGLTITRLADKAQVSKNTVWAIENGYQNAKLSTVKLIADALKISVVKLTDPTKVRITRTKAMLRAVHLLDLRMARGYSSGELSRRSGVSRSTIRRIETGGYTQTPSLRKLAEALDVTLEELTGS